MRGAVLKRITVALFAALMLCGCLCGCASEPDAFCGTWMTQETNGVPVQYIYTFDGYGK